jgi:riboflavin kinase/FMN adenylyltransferase
MTALTIGKFESLHKGHQRLLAITLAHAREHNLEPVAAAFEPHPHRVLYDPGYRPLFTLAEREHIVKGLGMKGLAVYQFDKDFAKMPPEEFCRRLIEDYHVRVLVLGEGYRFGMGRIGTTETLARYAETKNIPVHVLRHVTENGMKISTSDIRAHVQNGAVREAAQLLGFPFFIRGTVAHGKKIGHGLGFPTVNIQPSADKLLPLDGVYATQARIGHKVLEGITNIGLRPSVSKEGIRTVETFILDFNGDIYGRELQIDFLRFLRPEIKFDTLDALKAQIAKDVLRRSADRGAYEPL